MKILNLHRETRQPFPRCERCENINSIFPVKARSMLPSLPTALLVLSFGLYPHSPAVHINPLFSVFVPDDQVLIRNGELRICPPPAKILDGQCSSAERRQAFFFPERDYTAVGDVPDLDVGVWLGRRHYVPSASWFAYPIRAGYIFLYRVF